MDIELFRVPLLPLALRVGFPGLEVAYYLVITNER
jgi:hypothetical protein